MSMSEFDQEGKKLWPYGYDLEERRSVLKGIAQSSNPRLMFETISEVPIIEQKEGEYRLDKLPIEKQQSLLSAAAEIGSASLFQRFLFLKEGQSEKPTHYQILSLLFH